MWCGLVLPLQGDLSLDAFSLGVAQGCDLAALQATSREHRLGLKGLNISAQGNALGIKELHILAAP